MVYTTNKKKRTWMDYRNTIKYGLFFVLIISMIVAVRTYLNFMSIEEAISDVKIQIIDTREEIVFQEHFLVPYLDSPHARIFAANENNKPLPGSFFIQFTRIESLAVTQEQESGEVVIQEMTPQESWQQMFQDVKERNGW